jgi:hypothetical protein
MPAQKYFTYDANEGYETYATEEDAKHAASTMLEHYAEYAHEGWADEVDQVMWGEIRQRVIEIKTGHMVEFEGEQVECVDYKLENI